MVKLIAMIVMTLAVAWVLHETKDATRSDNVKERVVWRKLRKFL